MIRGIVALFTSGILTNPMVLLGIIVGSCFYGILDGSEIFQIYKNCYFYALAFLLSCIYVIGFRRIYKKNGDTDWFETLISVGVGVFKFVLASLLMMSFISFFDMSEM
jgi:hypothetical protein